MERRIDRIYNFVLENANVTTNDVAESLDIQRTNASKDLNLLVKDGQLSKSVKEDQFVILFRANQQQEYRTTQSHLIAIQ